MEMKTLSRNRLMTKLEKAYPDMMLNTTEEFDGRKGGIWTGAEPGPEDKSGMPLFDYYNEDYKEEFYIFGVRKHFHDFLDRNGWWCEWYDAGTMMIYPK